MTSFDALLAEAVLILLFSYVPFVVVGQILILTGWFLKWKWPRKLLFRWTHLAAIALVVGQSWLGIICPLTILEHNLRLTAGEGGRYETSFISDWDPSHPILRSGPLGVCGLLQFVWSCCARLLHSLPTEAIQVHR